MKYIILFIIFFLSFIYANAQVVINEVQISPIDERFIELYNMGDSDIDMTDWYIQRKTATGNFGSFVTSPNFENKTIKAGKYFLISRSSIDNADIVLDTMTLTEFNTIRIRNSEREDVDDIEWGNINEGKSYQRMLSGEWTVVSPTPGAQNESSNSDEENQKEEESSESISNPPSTSQGSSFPIEPQIFADAGEDRNVIIGADSLFEGKAFGLQKKPLPGARYVWNFGNGETKEGQNVLHYYKYPGEYVVMLNVSSGEYSASDRIVVNAYPAELVISKVENGFIEIYNKSNQELNLSWWQIQSGVERFMIPKDTIISSGKKLIFSNEITGLNTSVKESISLLYPNGVEAVKFEEIKIPQKVVAIKPIPSYESTAEKTKLIEEIRPLLIEDKSEENTAQTASVISSFKTPENERGIYKWLLAIFVVVGISAGIIVYASSKKELGDDIEIVD